MNYELDGQGEKVLFIHGSGWNAGMWHHQRDYLKSSLEVILVDLPGHGKSPGQACASVEKYSEAIYGLIKDLGVVGEPYIAGHSLGGAIAMSLALAYPEALKGVILIGTGARLKVVPQILDGITREKEKTVRSIVDLAFSKESPSAMKDHDYQETMKCPAETILMDFTACDHFDIMDSVHSIKLPTLIICGTNDALTPPKYSHYLNKAIEGSKLVLIEGAGHMVMREKPDEVNKAIEFFVMNQSWAEGRD
jgi:pimeloyl-ACP methyl ester carboxylesterase